MEQKKQDRANVRIYIGVCYENLMAPVQKTFGKGGVREEHYVIM